MSLALLALGIEFFQEVFHVLPIILSVSEADLVLVVLSLIDLALVGGLIVMVMLSSYESFVSRLDISSETDKLMWYVLIHLTFVLSAFGMGILDRVTREAPARP